MGRYGPTGFGVTLAAVFALIYRLREFPLSAVTNRFEMRVRIRLIHLPPIQNSKSLSRVLFRANPITHKQGKHIKNETINR